MWEFDDIKTKKKLKKDAVPTIFGNAVHQVNISYELGKKLIPLWIFYFIFWSYLAHKIINILAKVGFGTFTDKQRAAYQDTDQEKGPTEFCRTKMTEVRSDSMNYSIDYSKQSARQKGCIPPNQPYRINVIPSIISKQYTGLL